MLPKVVSDGATCSLEQQKRSWRWGLNGATGLVRSRPMSAEQAMFEGLTLQNSQAEGKNLLMVEEVLGGIDCTCSSGKAGLPGRAALDRAKLVAQERCALQRLSRTCQLDSMKSAQPAASRWSVSRLVRGADAGRAGIAFWPRSRYWCASRLAGCSDGSVSRPGTVDENFDDLDPLLQMAIGDTNLWIDDNRWFSLREEERLGAINAAKGKYFEYLVAARLNDGQQVGDLLLAPGQRAELAESMTQPGWDMRIVDAWVRWIPFATKATDSTAMSGTLALSGYADSRHIGGGGTCLWRPCGPGWGHIEYRSTSTTGRRDRHGRHLSCRALCRLCESHSSARTHGGNGRLSGRRRTGDPWPIQANAGPSRQATGSGEDQRRHNLRIGRRCVGVACRAGRRADIRQVAQYRQDGPGIRVPG